MEDAVTAFIVGVERGFVKCAFGLCKTVISYTVYTVSEEEAISIFTEVYSELKKLAQGDTEAMVMVAESLRLGFVDDEDEPYLFWLERAASLGNERAYAVLTELEEDDELDDRIAREREEKALESEDESDELCEIRDDFFEDLF